MKKVRKRIAKIHILSVVRANSFLEKSFGLMFQNSPRPLYFETRFGIHTFFVKTPIDILVLDRKGLVRAMGIHLMPFHLFLWSPKYNRVVELPKGTILKLNISKGDKIVIDFVVNKDS